MDLKLHEQRIGKLPHIAKYTLANVKVTHRIQDVASYPVHTFAVVTTIDEVFNISLTKLDLPLDNYQELRVIADETGHAVVKVHRSGNDPRLQCHYQGYVRNESISEFIGHLCSGGLSGSLTINGQKYSIEPAARHISSLSLTPVEPVPKTLHVLVNMQNFDQTQFSCGVDGEFASSPLLSHKKTTRTSSHGDSTGGTETHDHLHDHAHLMHGDHDHREHTLDAFNKTIELFIVNDYRRFAMVGEGTEVDSMSVATLMNQYYSKGGFNPTLSVRLVGQLTFTTAEADPFTQPLGSCTSGLVPKCAATEVDPSNLLNSVGTWAVGQVAVNGLKTGFDALQMHTGYDLGSSVVGLAYVATMCNKYSDKGNWGIVQTTFASTKVHSVVAAHELGHTLSLYHDGDKEFPLASDATCQSPAKIMAAQADVTDLPTTWSTCSIATARCFTTGKGVCTNVNLISDSCLDRTDGGATWAPRCGNGLVEEGEQCDCGSTTSCAATRDPCCTTSCTLHAGAQCSMSKPCCTSCKLHNPAVDGIKKCRPSVGNCDFDEYCDGQTVDCPTDFMYGSGTKCTSNSSAAGVCYKGACVSLDEQCKKIGSNFATPVDYSSCPLAMNPDSVDARCGRIRCRRPGGSSCEMLLMSSGKSVSMNDGSLCDTDKQCISKSCQPTSALNTMFAWVEDPAASWLPCQSCDDPQYQNTSCYSKYSNAITSTAYCSGNLRPNRLCQDQGLHCGVCDGVFCAISSTPIIIVISVGGAIFIAAVAGLLFWCKRKRQPTIPSSVLPVRRPSSFQSVRPSPHRPGGPQGPAVPPFHAQQIE